MSTRVFIGRLSYRANERDIESFFRGYGRIRDIVLKNGFGFVEFEDHRDADDAVYDLNGKDLCGERVTLEFSKRNSRNDSRGGGGGGRGGYAPPRRGERYQNESRYGPPTQTRHRLLVENLSTRVSWQDLKDICRKHGCEVTYADAHKATKNEAVVCFSSRDDLVRAIEKLDGEEINGRKLKLIDDSEKRDSRSRSRSRSRKRSASRSRSRSRSRSKSRSRSRSRSASPKKEASRSPRDKSRSASPAANGRGDKSRSGSPMD